MIIAAAVNLEKALIGIGNKLEKKYGVDNKKYQIIQSKISQLRDATEQFTRDFAKPIDESQNYHEIISQLDKTLRQSIGTYVKAVEITRAEAMTLAETVEKDKRRFHGFFHKNYDLVSKLNAALENSSNVLKNVMVKK
ncbi:hypothetical protein [Legionella cardiaca]|uniref:Uncharacterized protein n=1 Tax=Legionella cardiaca TaxID=1071983 RepID=A0ABY8APL6_9GAMM|nr:hypothetical protein [Legionella cardiaca]WED42374.1 hypothetical protein PXX05_10640 [Legionella cardiaca]